MSTKIDRTALLKDSLIVSRGLVDASKPVLVMFGADWCSYCVKQKPVVNELKAAYGDRVRFEILDADKEDDLKKAFGVSVIPAIFILSLSGNAVEFTKGFQSKAVLERKINNLLC
jgi:thioredoxin-like negative regulator of GroEL